MSSSEFVKNIEAAINQAHQAQEKQIGLEHGDSAATTERKYKSDMARIRTDFDKEMKTAKATYQTTHQQIDNEFERIRTELHASAFDWDDPFWENFTPLAGNEVPNFTRIGSLTTKGNYTTLQPPALLPIIGGQNVIIKASGATKDQALAAMQSLMLRLLATLPPGKLRFILIDPVGLGANMAGFVRTPDGLSDEQVWEEIVGGRAWTEANHIEQQLADLSTHMETVIQKYLGNKFESMEAYNEAAKEVAEPYRLLVVANFPVNFTEQAAQRLISIASNGPRCGVYVIVVVDTEQEMPYKFSLSELERTATIIEQQGNRFVWRDDVFSKCDLKLDQPPPDAIFNQMAQAIGEVAIEASRVEVPFAKVAPNSDEWWTEKTDDLLRVPIGFAGTKEQYFELGRGTAQHALIAGRTGSGKSALLHALILSLAMRYSPDEMQVYLVDFKVGIEFKDYATYSLPHARVVAIQSEREFGLSVLQELEREHQRRGDLFRGHHVQNLGQYRQARPDDKIPRILLIVDEFQLFFMEDDALASEISRIIDLLVRQGRSSGIHLLLASQSLAGSNLSRSIMGQMNVRVALQCNDTDSRVILGDENPAGRLLSRPGEGIYNAANGAIEGNDLFQVVWLEKEEREKYLRQIREHAEDSGWKAQHPQIVFEGNEPSKIENNRQLAEQLKRPSWEQKLRAIPAWLGEPVAIKPPTAATFRRQSRSNLLILGQNERTATAMLSTAIVSIAVHQSLEATRFYIINFSNVDADWHDTLLALGDALPHHVTIGRGRDLRKIVEELGAIVTGRSLLEDEAIEETIYLIIAGLQRARDLRKHDTYDPPTETAEQLSTILRDGPDLGVHTLVSCDNVANLERVLQRQDIDEFELRVAMQMNTNDSNNFIDSPAASKLDQYVALFFDEERYGVLEKFRPYDLPKMEWIERVGKDLSNHLAMADGG